MPSLKRRLANWIERGSGYLILPEDRPISFRNDFT